VLELSVTNSSPAAAAAGSAVNGARREIKLPLAFIISRISDTPEKVPLPIVGWSTITTNWEDLPKTPSKKRSPTIA
jgi:hypothetical protein